MSMTLLGRQVKTLEWITPETARVTTKTYDLLNRVIEERLEDLSEKIFKKETFAYDTAGNRTHVTTFTDDGPSR